MNEASFRKQPTQLHKFNAPLSFRRVFEEESFYWSRPANTVYIARQKLDLPGLAEKQIVGGDIFPKFMPKLQLTAPASQVSRWKLPSWMVPAGKASTLSYHGNLDRWSKQDDLVLLQAVSRGQEFVLDCGVYPEAIQWIRSLFVS